MPRFHVNKFPQCTLHLSIWGLGALQGQRLQPEPPHRHALQQPMYVLEKCPDLHVEEGGNFWGCSRVGRNSNLFQNGPAQVVPPSSRAKQPWSGPANTSYYWVLHHCIHVALNGKLYCLISLQAQISNSRWQGETHRSRCRHSGTWWRKKTSWSWYLSKNGSFNVCSLTRKSFSTNAFIILYKLDFMLLKIHFNSSSFCLEFSFFWISCHCDQIITKHFKLKRAVIWRDMQNWI